MCILIRTLLLVATSFVLSASVQDAVLFDANDMTTVLNGIAADEGAETVGRPSWSTLVETSQMNTIGGGRYRTGRSCSLVEGGTSAVRF